MKVLHLDSENTWGGGQSQLLILIKEQRKLGIECHLAARPGSLILLRGSDCCSTALVSMSNDVDLLAALRIASYCAANKIDIIHAHNGRSHALGLLSLYFYRNPKLVVHRRVDLPISKFPLNKLKYSNGKIAAYISVSRAVSSQLACLVDPAKITEVPDLLPDIQQLSPVQKIQIKEAFCRELGANPETPLILAAGRLSPEKGHSVLLEAFSILREKGVKFTGVLAGDGPLRHYLKREIGEKGLEKSVRLVGFRNDIHELIQVSDIYVMPSISEGLGSGILEAFAAGTPVIASRVGGIVDLVEDEMTGLLFQPGQANQAAEKIRRLLTDRPAAARLCCIARERALDRHDPEKLTKMVYDIYQRILSK